MKRIDLNCDVGELPEFVASGVQEALMAHVTSVNVACGAHAGDRATMEATLRAALRLNLQIGGHPGYPDRENFGRLDLAMTPEEIARSVEEQLRRLAEVAAECGIRIRHVKPHGALYNKAARDEATARAIADGTSRWSRDVALVGLAGSLMLRVFAEAGFPTAAEAFADRCYAPDGTLRPRRFPDSLITGPDAAAEQAVRLVTEGVVIAAGGSAVRVEAQTICIHGDTPGAARIAAAVAGGLRAAGVELRPMRGA